MEYLIYRVRKGEKAEDVARKTGVAARRICALNNCREEQIEEGVRMLIAQAEGREYVVRPFDSLSSVARRFNVSEKHILENNGLTSPTLFIGQKLYV